MGRHQSRSLRKNTPLGSGGVQLPGAGDALPEEPFTVETSLTDARSQGSAAKVLGSISLQLQLTSSSP